MSNEKRPKRGPKPAATADEIARAAVSIADREGFQAVSMQRVAHEVNLTAMALYRYFAGKAALVEHMIEMAGGPPPDLSTLPSWREKLAEWTRRCADIYRLHGWFLYAVPARRRVMGPNELAWLEAAFKALDETGLQAAQQHQAFLLLIGFVRSNAEFAAGADQGLSAEAWASRMVSGRDRCPALTKAIELGAFRASEEASFGLECLLSGIESIASKR